MYHNIAVYFVGAV